MTHRLSGKEIAPLCYIPSEPGIVTQRLAAAHDGDRTRRVKLARKPFERRAAIDIARIAAARREAEVARKVDQKQQPPQAKHESPDRRDEVRPLEPLPRQIGIATPRHALETPKVPRQEAA